MKPTLTLLNDSIGRTITAYADEVGKTLADTIKRAAKGATRRVIELTPPASEGITGAAAYRSGRKKIERQMHAVLAPKKLKGKRVITVVFGRRLARPITVKTREKYPDVVGLYRQHTKFSNTGTKVSISKPAKKFFVDEKKFNRLLRDKQSRVGRLASGWMAAAEMLDVPVQNWIKRHGRALGSVKVNLLTSRMRIDVSNHASGVPEHVKAEMKRRIGYAVEYQRAAMEREMRYVMMKRAQEHAIKTRDFSGIVPEGMMGG